MYLCVDFFQKVNNWRDVYCELKSRGMKNKWLGPYRDECIIGENWEFIKFHNDKVNEWSEETPYLPVPYEKGFALTDKIPE